jgi:hypothetical protein
MLGCAGSSLHTSGVPHSLDSQTGKYGALLLMMSVVAPWEQANNASMFAEVRAASHVQLTGLASRQDCCAGLRKLDRAALCIYVADDVAHHLEKSCKHPPSTYQTRALPLPRGTCFHTWPGTCMHGMCLHPCGMACTFV